VLPDQRADVVAAARRILDQGGWCVLEACVDVPAQRWEVAELIFDLTAEAVAEAVAEAIEEAPELDLRLSGLDQRLLEPNPAMGAYLCYVAASPERANATNA
jgi:hypothetical protein